MSRLQRKMMDMRTIKTHARSHLLPLELQLTSLVVLHVPNALLCEEQEARERGSGMRKQMTMVVGAVETAEVNRGGHAAKPTKTETS